MVVSVFSVPESHGHLPKAIYVKAGGKTEWGYSMQVCVCDICLCLQASEKINKSPSGYRGVSHPYIHEHPSSHYHIFLIHLWIRQHVIKWPCGYAAFCIFNHICHIIAKLPSLGWAMMWVARRNKLILSVLLHETSEIMTFLLVPFQLSNNSTPSFWNRMDFVHVSKMKKYTNLFLKK